MATVPKTIQRVATASLVAKTYFDRFEGLALKIAKSGLDYFSIYDVCSSQHSDAEIRAAVHLSKGLPHKVALYWKEKGRRYVPTQSELDSGCFLCPKCRTEMRHTVYKTQTKLYACPSCLFLIKPSDILNSVEDKETREKAKKQLGWTNPSTSFNDWL